MKYEVRLDHIKMQAEEKAEENDHFMRSLRNHEDDVLDKIAQSLNEKISAEIDCMACANCCKSLIINITPPEITELAAFLQMPEAEVREKHIEESLQGACYISSIPCHFLEGSVCGIYDHRFTECRDFPHLHKPGFRQRFLGTLLHYGNCPIIYNVTEAMKKELGFIG